MAGLKYHPDAPWNEIHMRYKVFPDNTGNFHPPICVGHKMFQENPTNVVRDYSSV